MRFVSKWLFWSGFAKTAHDPFWWTLFFQKLPSFAAIHDDELALVFDRRFLLPDMEVTVGKLDI
jgi:hypothetical protein